MRGGEGFSVQAAVSPGFVALTSLWYKKDERESTSAFVSLFNYHFLTSGWYGLCFD
jgi:hypothetical protein